MLAPTSDIVAQKSLKDSDKEEDNVGMDSFEGREKTSKKSSKKVYVFL